MEFDYNQEYILEDERVLLTPLIDSHIDSLCEISNDTEIWQYLLEEGRYKEDLKQYIDKAVDDRKEHKAYPFAVFDKKSGEMAGTTRIYELNLAMGHTKIGHTWYGALFRGSGMNYHVKFLLFELLFERLKLSRVGFGVHELNERSIYALEKLGIQQEGRLRDFLPNTLHTGKKKRYDIILFSLLSKEWQGHTKQTIKGLISNLQVE